ncbi:FISUMP domain-containing protein [Prevotella sp. 10(H)]|uniref:immunoglobulin domain-containing protein n=1 Tax=Prevotella sp. 10(H) TaxID=1158294 RepID=UPI0004A77977|nr:FISUMP domain-containing protein [Prevotella sp. 10(H)]
MEKTFTKSYRYRILVFLVMLLATNFWLNAQVTIGDGIAPQDYSILEVVSNGTGGFRLPQLSSQQRNGLNMSSITDAEKKAKAIGLTIMNTDNGCYEYWNGAEWISLCEGQSDIGFVDENGQGVDPTKPPFVCEGGSRGPFTPKEEKQCSGISTPYTYTVVSGQTMINLQVISPATGKFTISVNENPTARVRTAIVRVTNNCTGKHRDLLFVQEGCGSKLCNESIAKPVVNVTNNGQLCQNGAVYMHITNPDNNATYIWTLHDVEVGQGIWYTANIPGEYIVYVNAIGCVNSSDRIKITESNTAAPSANIVIHATNNGIICGNSGTVRIMAFNVPAEGTLTWYRDGQKTTKTGNPITLGSSETGSWFAVMEDGDCTSRPSNKIDVVVSNQSESLIPPIVHVNGSLLSTISSFCKGGRLNFELINYDDYYTTHQVAVTVDWYNGTTHLGEGPSISVIAPFAEEFVLRCVVSDNTGVFCSSETMETKTLSGNAPKVPGISGVPYICGGVPTSLTAMVSGTETYTYNWYKDDILLPETGQTLFINEIGTYRVAVVNGECISDKSLPVTVSLSDFPELRWSTGADTAEPNQVKTYLVEGFYNPTKYTWQVDNGAKIENGQGTRTATILFPDNETTVNISVVAENHCGTGNTLTKEVIVKKACTSPSIAQVTMTPSSGTIVAGNSLSMQVRLNECTPPFTYRWLHNGAMVHEEISDYRVSTYTIPNIQKTQEGTYSVVVSNHCGNAGPELAGTIMVRDMNIPDGEGRLSGIDCFDVVQSNDNSDCGRLKIREPYKADFTKKYDYTFTSMGHGNSNLTFFIDDAEEAVESYTVQPNIPPTLANGGKYTITVKYKESLMQTAAGRDNNNPITVVIYALYRSGGREMKTRRFVTIKDCDCCATVMDLEENEYTAHRFGDAGCWMTMNLRSTYNETMWKGAIVESSKASITDSELKAYYYPLKDKTILERHPEAGLLYSWLAATYGVIAEVIQEGEAGKTRSKVQGICPEGWVLPSDFDWSELEKAIASEPNKYSTMPSQNLWYESARYETGIRGNWGPAFISPNPFAAKPSGGQSKNDGTGFNGLLVGEILNNLPFRVGEHTTWWATATNYRYLQDTYARSYRADKNKMDRDYKAQRFILSSVRCKKWEE